MRKLSKEERRRIKALVKMMIEEYARLTGKKCPIKKH